MTEKEFTINWTEEVSKGLLKNFPNDFILNMESESMKLPGQVLVLGSELFGSYELTDAEGNSLLSADSYYKAKYIIYSNKEKPSSIEVPKDEEEMIKAVKEYEKHLDQIIVALEKQFKKEFPESKNFLQVSNTIFNSLKLSRL